MQIEEAEVLGNVGYHHQNEVVMMYALTLAAWASTLDFAHCSNRPVFT